MFSSFKLSQYATVFALLIIPIGGCASAGGNVDANTDVTGAGTGVSEPDGSMANGDTDRKSVV